MADQYILGHPCEGRDLDFDIGFSFIRTPKT